jgi:DnaJ-class molecular chaperone
MSGLDEPAKVLSLGSVIGGRTLTNRGWSEAIRGLTREIAAHRDGISSDINVNVEFHVPGNLLKPEFEGVRTGTFRKGDALIKVQVALPEQPPTDPRVYLVGRVRDALDAVDRWSDQRKANLSTANLRALLAELEAPQ